MPPVWHAGRGSDAGRGRSPRACADQLLVPSVPAGTGPGAALTADAVDEGLVASAAASLLACASMSRPGTATNETSQRNTRSVVGASSEARAERKTSRTMLRAVTHAP